MTLSTPPLGMKRLSRGEVFGRLDITYRVLVAFIGASGAWDPSPLLLMEAKAEPLWLNEQRERKEAG